MPKPTTERDLFAAFARFGRTQNLTLHDPQLAEEFAATLKADLARALKNPIWLHGNRVQNMFEAMVIAFDHHVLIKTEDAGDFFPKDRFALPDFRVVLKAGGQMLVEVKNVYALQPGRQRFTIKRAYLRKLQDYALTVACDLRLALFFARWGIWTLIDPLALKADGNALFIDMGEAVQVSELARLGDQTIGTRAPLQLRFLADHTKPRKVDVHGMVAMTIAAVKTYCRGVELTSARDREMAWLMMQFGDWESGEPTALMDGSLVDGIEFRWDPVEPSDQGFDFIGSASRMFARYYSLRTVEDKAIVRVAPETKPGLFRVLTTGDAKSDALPLWRIIQQPNRKA